MGLSPARIRAEIPHTDIIPLLKQSIALKADQTLKMISAFRGKADNVNDLARNMRRNITDAEVDETEKKEMQPLDWNDNISKLAAAVGSTKTARKAKQLSTAARLMDAARKEG